MTKRMKSYLKGIKKRGYVPGRKPFKISFRKPPKPKPDPEKVKIRDKIKKNKYEFSYGEISKNTMKKRNRRLERELGRLR